MQYPFVMFDWGNTVMRDNPAYNTPMCQWPVVEAVEGAEEVLCSLHGERRIVLATAAEQSDEAQIRLALRRVNLEGYFERIFCFKNTGLRKPTEAFYCYIVGSLEARAADILMVGDSFEADVLAANRVGIHAVWFNQKDAEKRTGELHRTIHHLGGLLDLLKAP